MVYGDSDAGDTRRRTSRSGAKDASLSAARRRAVQAASAFQTHVAAILLSALVVAAGCASSGAMRGPIAPGATQEGTASYYADKFVGRPTASGEPYAHDSLTAAHRSLPFGTVVRVRRLDTGEAVVVRINDRGPFKRGRIIDLSREAARQIDLLQVGIADVRLTILSLPDGTPVAPPPTGPTW
jgi:rare lipoprotein A